MATWSEISTNAPDLASAVERSFGVGKHKVMATLRRDGSPRVSGTEVVFRSGEVWIGSMPGARKAQDLQRDPRIAIHSPTVDEELTLGDAKLSGTAVEVTEPAVIEAWLAAGAEEGAQAPPPGEFHLFRIDVTEVARTWVEGDELVVASWGAERGERTERRK
jgi:hypothetical protein